MIRFNPSFRQRIQYCCYDYVKTLQTENIRISMTEKGDPYENAVAERVNEILKDEWIESECFRNFQQAESRIGHIIKIYNELRAHMSCDILTPKDAYNSKGKLKKRWSKNLYQKIIGI